MPTGRLNLRSVSALARAAAVPEYELRELARSAEDHYILESRPKRSGGQRLLAKPHAKLKRVQRAIDRRVLRQLPFSSVAFGGVPGRNHIDGARRHARRPEGVACVDIKDYFPSVSHHHVYQLFTSKGCSPDVARLLTQILTWRGGLPQGSPASPTVANLLLEDLDASLVSFQKRGLTATRFVDDIAVSGPIQRVREAIGDIIHHVHRRGLRINRRKLRIQNRGQRQQVTNLNVNRTLALPKTAKGERILSLKALRDTVKRAERYGLRPKEEQQLRGRLNYLAQLNERQSQSLLARLDRATARNNADPR